MCTDENDEYVSYNEADVVNGGVMNYLSGDVRPLTRSERARLAALRSEPGTRCPEFPGGHRCVWPAGHDDACSPEADTASLPADAAYARGYAARWTDGDAFLAQLDAAEAEVSGERDAGPHCTGTLFATGEDGMETVDHDGGCPVHDEEDTMANPAYPNGRCDVCGWGVRPDGTCPNDDCQEYVPGDGDGS